MNEIAIYGATDRFNYGDLLFPLVVEWAAKQYRPGSDIYNLAIAESDFSNQGGLPTISIKDAFSNGLVQRCDRFVIAGGQVLDARWTAILGYLLGPRTDLTVRAIRKLLGERTTDTLARRIAGLSWPQPFVVPEGGLPEGVGVVYNAVGGAEIDSLRPGYLEALRRGLEKAAYISVRDCATRDALAKFGIHADLMPDSAVVMSRIFPLPTLLTRVRDELRNYLAENSGQYLVFQIGTKFVKGREQIIAKTVSDIASKQGLKIMLLAIGTATAHEDHIALEKVRRHLPAACNVYPMFNGSVWEIMAAIASAAIYIGTSLHGAITAMSFGIPRLAYTGEVRKLQEYLNTWDLNQFSDALPVDGNNDLIAKVLSVGGAECVSLSGKVINQADCGLRNLFEMRK